MVVRSVGHLRLDFFLQKDKNTEGSVFLHISMVGFKNFSSPAFDGKLGKDFGSIKLQTLDNELKSVTVTARKPTFVMEADKMVGRLYQYLGHACQLQINDLTLT